MKHTFLEFQMETLLASSSVRPRSAPPLRHSHTVAFGSMTMKDDAIQEMQVRCFAKDGAIQMQAPSASKSNASLPSLCGTSQQRRGEGRPPKAKRDKFRKFVDMVKQQALNDPNFQMDKIQIPKSLNRGNGTIQKIVSLLQTPVSCISNDGAKLPSPRGATRQRKGQGRPYKAQRRQFRRFVEEVKQKTLQDPNFTLDGIQVPKCLNRRVGTMKKIESIVQQSFESV